MCKGIDENFSLGFMRQLSTIMMSFYASSGNHDRNVMSVRFSLFAIENSHFSSGTICMRNQVEVGGPIRNYLELICCVTHYKLTR